MLIVSSFYLGWGSAPLKTTSDCVSGLYLYLSENWELGDSAVWWISSLNCYQFPGPAAILCVYISTFPNHPLLSQPFETQGRPGRLKQKAFTSKDRDIGLVYRFSFLFLNKQILTTTRKYRYRFQCGIASVQQVWVTESYLVITWPQKGIPKQGHSTLLCNFT